MDIEYRTYSKTIPTLITFIVSVIVFSEYFIDVPEIVVMSNAFRSTSILIFAFTILLGALSLILWRRRKIITEKGKDRYFTIWSLLVLIIFSGSGLILGVSSEMYAMMFENIRFPIAQAMSGCRAFWCTSAVYRAWRARNRESFAMFITGVLVIVGLSPWGSAFWGGFTTIGDWIMTYINAPGMRAIIIGGAIGIIVVSVRTILGKEIKILGA